LILSDVVQYVCIASDPVQGRRYSLKSNLKTYDPIPLYMVNELVNGTTHTLSLDHRNSLSINMIPYCVNVETMININQTTVAEDLDVLCLRLSQFTSSRNQMRRALRTQR
jgi:hypothetical protein